MTANHNEHEVWTRVIEHHVSEHSFDYAKQKISNASLFSLWNSCRESCKQSGCEESSSPNEIKISAIWSLTKLKKTVRISK
ncbi:hypothetical protein evm_002230 [Chilo suppressalis]|nr:hypothetical protein evm_002230 [Chilo suppressalis]